MRNLNLNDWFEKGVTEQAYIDAMQINKEKMLTIFEKYTLCDVASAQSLRHKKLRAIVITADWCGDAMVNLPIFMKLAKEAHIEASYLMRDENLELMDQYLTNGTARSIPIIIFIDEQGNEVAKWGPRASKIQVLADEQKASLPEKETENYEIAFKEYVRKMTNLYVNEPSIWKIIEEDLLFTLSK